MTEQSMTGQARAKTRDKPKGKGKGDPPEPDAEAPAGPSFDFGGQSYRVAPVENSAPILLAVYDAGTRNPLRLFAALEQLLEPPDYLRIHNRIQAGELAMTEVSDAVIAACQVMLDRPTLSRPGSSPGSPNGGTPSTGR